MKLRSMSLVTVLLLGAATLVDAQPATRAEEARAARDHKAQVLAPASPGRIERLLNALERRSLLQNLVAPADGFGVRLGGMDDGGGLALGPSWRHTSLAGGHLALHASAAWSLRGDREVDFRLQLPHLLHDRVGASLTSTMTELAQEQFYGVGQETSLANRTAFALGRQSIVAAFALKPAPPLTLDVISGLHRTRLRSIGGVDVSGSAVDYLHTRVAATLDYRDQPGNPRSGGRYHAAVHRFAGGSRAAVSFTRLDAEVEQHLSTWKKQRLVTLRAVGSLSTADPGHDVPFFMQRTLGGSRLLRGFVHDRFRDTNLLVLQAEYGWDISPFLNAVIFYETGAVAPTAEALLGARLRRDYGLGVRLGSTRAVALRTDLAFGSGEGARLSMRFSHAF